MKPLVSTKSELFSLIVRHKSDIRKYGVAKIGVFGSFVRDEANRKSDVDLMVDFEPGKKTFDNFMDLNFFMEDITGRRVQILTPQYINRHLKPYILKELEYVEIPN